jgi:hypothetical protein
VSSLLQFELNCNAQYGRHIFINAEIVNTSLVNNNTLNYSYSFRDLTKTNSASKRVKNDDLVTVDGDYNIFSFSRN